MSSPSPAPPPAWPEPLMGYAELAAHLGISQSWLRHKIRSLPHEKYGRWVRFSRDNVAQIRQMHAIDPAATLATTASGLRDLVPLGPRRNRTKAP